VQRITLTLFSCSLLLACSALQAQEVELKSASNATEQVADVAKTLETEAEEETTANESNAPTKLEEDAGERVALADKTEVAEESKDLEEAVDDLDEDADDEGETTEGEIFEGPAVVAVNERGELVGRTTAVVNGDSTPIEANITLVSGGILIGKSVADEDGSFSFSNIMPGEYEIFGCAASYCGQRACNVVSEGDYDVVQVRMDQSSVCGCNRGYASAPATSFDTGLGGFSGGSSFSSGASFGGGGFGGGGGGSAVGGGGGLLGSRGFRLLSVGGVATAIAVGSSDDDDDVSPSE